MNPLLVVYIASHGISEGDARTGKGTRQIFGLSAATRSDSCLDQLLHQRCRQRFVCGESDRAFAGPEAYELILERFDGGGTHWIKRAVIRPRAEGNEQTPIQTKRGESVADALLRLGRDGADSLAEFLEGGSLIGIHARKIFVDRPGFGLR
jgi:hypothetical protein